MKKTLVILTAAGVMALFLSAADVSATQGRQAGKRTGQQEQARDGRGNQAGQGDGQGQYRKGSGRGHGWHRDGTGLRAGDRERELNCK